MEVLSYCAVCVYRFDSINGRTFPDSVRRLILHVVALPPALSKHRKKRP
jgi:hypothetical protein